MDKTDLAKDEYREWCRKIGIRSAEDINRVIKDGHCDRLINVSEAWQEQKLSEIAFRIGKSKAAKKIIFISGPSSSGKTSFASRLQIHLAVNGIRSIPVSLDDYYIDKSEMPKLEDGSPDYETLEAIDYKLFNENVNDLIRGKTVMMPRYDFDKSVPIKNAYPLSLREDEALIVEGIHGLNPKIADNIDDEKKYKIYCSALTVITDENGDRIRSSLTRKIRRTVRDFYFRNADWQETFGLWPNQEAGSEKYIFPYTNSADMVFNSSLLYEFCVYRSHLEKILKNTGDSEARQLLEIAELFAPIDRDITPRSSIIREFVGGSSLWQ